MPKKPSVLLQCLLVSSLCILLCWTYAQLSFKQAVTQTLQQQLPVKLQSALYYSANDGPIMQLIQHNVDADLQVLPTSSFLPLLAQCHLNVLSLISHDDHHAWFNQINIKWLLGNKQVNTLFAFHCDTNWIASILYPLGFVTLLILLWRFLPRPLSAKGLQIRQQLQQYMAFYPAHQLARQLNTGSDTQLELFEHLMPRYQQKQDIDALLLWLAQPQVETLNPEQLAWFMLASRQYQLPKEHALEVALTPATLCFGQEQGQLIIHGLTLTLFKTPYFYYLWYANLRCQSEGWHLNPPVNRSDTAGAAELIELMQSSGGHNKAINDLLAYGLRAKILDQNRNKLKAELISLLGENLAQDYLFDTERDLKSGRYRYRLRLPPHAITLPSAYKNTSENQVN
ncbi:hypothetical protein [Paraglaciecola sp.]|uniref:hypothetical protein n=1 Tax=Paraglaciecola sp. TaxID=1920173 RepID=UPI0030F3F616